MTRTVVATMLTGALSVGAIGVGLVSAPASAQVEIVVAPPAAWIATSSPVYFEGHPAYWYGNRWYYRDGRNWAYYHSEPRFLFEYRGRREPVRHFYERGHGFRHR